MHIQMKQELTNHNSVQENITQKKRKYIFKRSSKVHLKIRYSSKILAQYKSNQREYK